MLDNVKSMIGGACANIKIDWKFFLIMLAVALLIGAIIYVYRNYVAPKLSPTYVANKEFVRDDGTGSGETPIAYVTLFSTTWCPHCTKLKKEGIFQEFMNQNQGKVINGYKLDIQEIDCSNDQDPNIKKLLDQYKVDGFPSIKLLKGGDDPSQAIDFDAKPQIDSLNQFVSTVL